MSKFIINKQLNDSAVVDWTNLSRNKYILKKYRVFFTLLICVYS